VLTSPNPD